MHCRIAWNVLLCLSNTSNLGRNLEVFLKLTCAISCHLLDNHPRRPFNTTVTQYANCVPCDTDASAFIPPCTGTRTNLTTSGMVRGSVPVWHFIFALISLDRTHFLSARCVALVPARVHLVTLVVSVTISVYFLQVLFVRCQLSS